MPQSQHQPPHLTSLTDWGVGARGILKPLTLLTCLTLLTLVTPTRSSATTLTVEVLSDLGIPEEKELVTTFIAELKDLAGKRTPIHIQQVQSFSPGAKVTISTSGQNAALSLNPAQIIGSPEYLRKTLQPVIALSGKRPLVHFSTIPLPGLAEAASQLSLGPVLSKTPDNPAIVLWPATRPTDIDQTRIQDLRKKGHLVLTLPHVPHLLAGGFACLETEIIPPLARLSALRAWRLVKGLPAPKPADILEISPLLVVNQRALQISGLKVPLESRLQVEVRDIEPLSDVQALSLKRAQEKSLLSAPGIRANLLLQASGKEKEASASTLKSLRVSASADAGTQFGRAGDHDAAISVDIVKPLVNREIRHRQTLAALEVELSQLAGASLRLRLEALTMHRYLDVLEQRDRVRVQEEQLTILRRNMRIARDRVAAGVAAPEEAGRQQIQAENTLASISQARDTLLAAIIALSQLTGEEVSETVLMDDALASEKTLLSLKSVLASLQKPATRKAIASKLLQETILKHPDFESIRSREQQALASSRIVKALSTPTTQVETRLSHQDGQNFGNDRSSLEARVRVNIPVFSAGRDRFERRARELEARAQAETLEQEKDNLNREIRQLLSRLGQSWQSWEVLEKASQTAEKNLIAIEARYRQGLLPQLNLLDAEREVLNARTRSVNERFLLIRSLMTLFEKTGQPAMAAKPPGGREWQAFLSAR